MPLQYQVFYRQMDAKGDAIVQAAVSQAIADAEKLWQPETFDGVFSTKGFGVARLEKWHMAPNSTAAFGSACGPSNDWAVSITTAFTWETIYTATTSDDVYAVITGVFNYDATPDITHIKITADGVEYPVMDIEEIYGWDIAVAYMSHPIIIRPQKNYRIECKAKTAGRKAFGLLGYAIARRSKLIQRIA